MTIPAYVKVPKDKPNVRKFRRGTIIPVMLYKTVIMLNKRKRFIIGSIWMKYKIDLYENML